MEYHHWSIQGSQGHEKYPLALEFAFTVNMQSNVTSARSRKTEGGYDIILENEKKK